MRQQTEIAMHADPCHMDYREINAMLYELVHMYVRSRLDSGTFTNHTFFNKQQALKDFSDFMRNIALSEEDHGCKEE